METYSEYIARIAKIRHRGQIVSGPLALVFGLLLPVSLGILQPTDVAIIIVTLIVTVLGFLASTVAFIYYTLIYG